MKLLEHSFELISLKMSASKGSPSFPYHIDLIVFIPPRLSQLARGMKYIHETAKLIHRDLKTLNILVSDSGQVSNKLNCCIPNFRQQAGMCVCVCVCVCTCVACL